MPVGHPSIAYPLLLIFACPITFQPKTGTQESLDVISLESKVENQGTLGGGTDVELVKDFLHPSFPGPLSLQSVLDTTETPTSIPSQPSPHSLEGRPDAPDKEEHGSPGASHKSDRHEETSFDPQKCTDTTSSTTTPPLPPTPQPIVSVQPHINPVGTPEHFPPSPLEGNPGSPDNESNSSEQFPVGRISIVSQPLLIVPCPILSKLQASKTQESYEISYESKEPREQPTVSLVLPQHVDAACDEAKGSHSNSSDVERAPPFSVEPPSPIPTSRQVLVQPTLDPAKTQDATPPQSISPLPSRSSGDRPSSLGREGGLGGEDSPNEEDHSDEDEGEPSPPLPGSPIASPQLPTTSCSTPSKPKVETREPREVTSHGSEKYKEVPSSMSPGLPRDADVTSGEVENEGLPSESADIKPARIHYAPSLIIPPVPSLTSQPVLPAQPTTHCADTRTSSSPPPPLSSPPPSSQSPEERPGNPDEEEPDSPLSLSPGRSPPVPSPPPTALSSITHQLEGDVQEPHKVASLKSEGRDEGSSTTPFDLPRHMNITFDEVEGKGVPGGRVDLEPASPPPLTSPPVPPVRVLDPKIPAEQPEPFPSSRPHSPSLLPPQSSDNGSNEGEPCLPPSSPVSRPSVVQLPLLTVPHRISQKKKAATQESLDAAFHENEGYEEELLTTLFDLPEPTDITSKTDDENVYNDSVDLEPTKVPTPPIFIGPSRPVLFQPSPDPVETSGPAPSPKPPPLPLQSSKDRPDHLGEGNSPDEENGLSLPSPVGCPFIVPPLLLTTSCLFPSKPKAQTQESLEVSSHESECEGEPPTMSLDFPQFTEVTPRTNEDECVPSGSLDVGPVKIPLSPVTGSPLPPLIPRPAPAVQPIPDSAVTQALTRPPRPYLTLLPPQRPQELSGRPNEEGPKGECSPRKEKPDPSLPLWLDRPPPATSPLVPSQPEAETREPHQAASRKSNECEDKPTTTSTVLPRSTDIPHPTIVPPSPPTFPPVLPVQSNLKPIFSQPPSPPPLLMRGPQERSNSASEGDPDEDDGLGGTDGEKAGPPLPPVSLPSVAPSPLLTVPYFFFPQSKTERQESHDISSDESEGREKESPMMAFDPPQSTDVVSNEGFCGDSVDVGSVEIFAPSSTELPLAPPNSRLVLQVQPTPEPIPPPQLPSPSPLSPQSPGDRPANPSEEGDSDGERPVPSMPKAETQEPHEGDSHESGEGEGAIDDNIDVAEAPTSHPSILPPSPLLTSQPVLPVHLPSDPKETPEPALSEPILSPPSLPQQNLEEGSDSPSEEDGSDAEHGCNEGNGPDEHSLDEEELHFSLPLPVGHPSAAPPPLLTVPQPKAKTQEPRTAAPDESKECEGESTTMLFGLSPLTDAVSNQVEDEGPPCGITNPEPTEVPTPPHFAESPLIPLTSRPDLPFQPTPNRAETPEIIPSPQPASPLLSPLRSSEDRSDSSSEGGGPGEESGSSLPSQVGFSSVVSPLLLNTSCPIPSQPKNETQEPPETPSHQCEKTGDGPITVPSDLPKPTDIVSNEVGDDGLPSDIVNVDLAETSKPPSFTEPPLTPLASQPVLPATPDPTETPETTPPSKPSPPPLPQQSLEGASDGDSEEGGSDDHSSNDHSSDEHNSDEEGDSLDEHSPDEGEHDPSLPFPVGHPSVAPPPLITAPRQKPETQEAHTVTSGKSEESPMVPFALPRPTDVVSDEGEGFPNDNANVGPAEAPMPPSSVEPPLTPLISRPALLAEPTPGPTETLDTTPPPQLPPPISLQHMEGSLVSYDEEGSSDEDNPGEERPNSSPSPSVTPLFPHPPTDSPPATSMPITETQKPHNEEYEDESPTLRFDTPKPADSAPGGVEDEGFPNESVDMVEVPTPLPSTPPQPPPPTSQPVLPVHITSDTRETPGITSPPSLLQQSLEDRSVSPSEGGSDEGGSLGGHSTDEGKPDPPLSLPVGRPFVASPLLLTAPNQRSKPRNLKWLLLTKARNAKAIHLRCPLIPPSPRTSVSTKLKMKVSPVTMRTQNPRKFLRLFP